MQLMLLALRGTFKTVMVASTNLAYLETILKSFPERLIKDSTNMFDPLGQRELDVLKLIAEGCSNEEICQRLFLALDTVKVITVVFSINCSCAVEQKPLCERKIRLDLDWIAA